MKERPIHATAVAPVSPAATDVVVATETVAVLVSSRLYALCCGLGILLHSVCACYCALFVFVYASLFKSMLSEMLVRQSVGLDPSWDPLFAAVYGCFAVAHLALAAHVGAKSTRCSRRRHSPRLKEPDPRESRPGPVMDALASVFGDYGVLGIQGKHYDSVFVVRKLFGVLSLVLQAFRVATSVSSVWLVRAYVTLLASSCLAPTLANCLLTTRHLTLTRLSCLLCDIVLDIGVVVGLHSVLAVGFTRAINWELMTFQLGVFKSSEKLTLVVNELRFVLVSSWLDLVSRVITHTGIILSLRDAMVLLKVRPHAGRIMNVSNSTTVPAIRSRSLSQATRGLELFTPCLGLAVLVLYGLADSRSLGMEAGCVLPIQLWLSSRPGCAMLMINCSAFNISGSSQQLTALLSATEFSSVQLLGFSNCPDLHIPPVLQQFQHLNTLAIYHSSVTEWTSEAALTATHHPMLSRLTTAGVNFPQGELPPGLLHDAFPRRLRNIVLMSSNVAILPDAIATSWPRGVELVWAFSRVRVIPPMFAQMEFAVLSLVGNEITDIPLAQLYAPISQAIDLTFNPIASLPDIPTEMLEERGCPLLHRATVYLTGTRVERLPSWFTQCPFALRVANTPLCLQAARDNRTLPPQVDCVTKLLPLI